MTNYDELRKPKKISWCGKEIELKEITVTDLISLESLNKEKASEGEDVEDSLSNQDALIEQIKEVAKTATGLELDEILRHPPSHIKKLILEVENLNEDFFGLRLV